MFGVQGAFLIWHGMSQTACLMVSLVDGSGRIEHLRLDRQQLAARPLQVLLTCTLLSQAVLSLVRCCSVQTQQPTA